MHKNQKFLHKTIFSPHVSNVIYVTNMRYAVADDIYINLTFLKVYLSKVYFSMTKTKAFREYPQRAFLGTCDL